MLKIEESREELSKKTYHQIQKETAYRWASRACAAYEWVSDGNNKECIVSWTVAGEYFHEAIEHAALTENDAPTLLKEIQEAVEPYIQTASDYLDRKFKQDMSKEV